MESTRRKRNVLIVSGIVAGVFLIIHMIISFYAGRFNIIYSLIGAAIFFVLYFVFQMFRNIFLDKAK